MALTQYLLSYTNICLECGDIAARKRLAHLQCKMWDHSETSLASPMRARSASRRTIERVETEITFK